MPIDPMPMQPGGLPDLNVAPPQSTNPLEDLARVQAIKQQQQMGPLQVQGAQLQLQQQQMEMQSQQALMKAWADNGGDIEKTLAAAPKAGVLPQHVMALQSNMLKMAQERATTDKTVQEASAAKHDAINAAYQPLFDEADPDKRAAMLPAINQQILQANPGIRPTDLLQAADDQTIRHAKAAYTTDKWLTQQAANITAKSKLDNATSEIQSRAAALPGVKAKADQEARSNAASQLATVSDPAEYDRIRDAYIQSGGSAATFPSSRAAFDPTGKPRPEVQKIVRQSGLTAEQQQQAENLQNKPLSEPEQALNAAARLYAQKNNIPFDAGKPWQAQLPPEVAPMIFKAAKNMSEPTDVAAMRALTMALNQQRLQDANEKHAAIPEYVNMMRDNPDIYHEFTPEQKALVGPAWRAATGLSVPIKLNPEMQKTEQLSQVALQHVQNIRAALQDPAIQGRMGAIMGRLGEGEQMVGDTAGLTPEQARKAQDLRSSMTYLFMREGKALLGGRPPERLMEELHKTSPRVSEAMPMINGSLDAVDRSARSVIQSAEQQRFGGQTRPNFQAGFQNKPVAASGIPQGVRNALGNQGPGVYPLKNKTTGLTEKWSKQADGTITKVE